MHIPGEFIIKYRTWLTAGIIGLSVLLSFFLPSLKMEEDESIWFSADDPILRTYREFQDEFVTDELAVVAYRAEHALSGPELQYLDSLSRRLEKIPNVVDVLSLTTVDDIKGTTDGLEIKPLVKKEHGSRSSNPDLRERIRINHLMRPILISKDYCSVGIILELEWPKADKQEAGDFSLETVESIKAFLQQETESTGRTFYLGGNTVTDAEVVRVIDRDMHIFFPLSILLVSLVVLFLFRSLIQVFFPVLSVTLALEWTLALKGMFHSPITPVSTTLFALINVMGIANAIHLISQFNLSMQRLGDRMKALRETLQRAGRACFFTSLTTALGFGSLGVSPLPVIRDMGLFSAFGIMSAFLISMILIPFGIMLVRKPVPAAGFRAPVRFNAFLQSIAGFDLRHPRWIIAAGLTIAVFMTTGIFRIRTESSMIKYLKSGSTLRQDAEFLDGQLMGVSSAEVIITGSPDKFKQPENLRKMEELQKLAETYPAVAVTHSLVDYLKLIYRALNNDDSLYFRVPDTREAVAQSLLLYEMSGGEDLDEYVTMEYDKVRIGIRTRQMDQEQRKSLLDTLHAFTKRNFPGCTLAVTGFDTLVYETTNRIIQTEIRSISLALAVILVIMCFLFGLKGGLVSIVPNLLPILFLLGLMGYGGFSLDMATAIIASIAIGIVVDDTIHYFFHYRHELRDLGDWQKALIHAHRKVGSALCFTTVCLILGFGIFLFSDTFVLINYGLLSGIAVAVALLGDLFLGPVLLVKLKVFKK